MFVITKYDTVVNIANYDKIEIKFSCRPKNANSGPVYHVIHAVSESATVPNRESESPLITSKLETLAHFKDKAKEKAQNAYNLLCQALLEEAKAFDMKKYNP